MERCAARLTSRRERTSSTLTFARLGSGVQNGVGGALETARGRRLGQTTALLLGARTHLVEHPHGDDEVGLDDPVEKTSGHAAPRWIAATSQSASTSSSAVIW